MQTLLFSLLVGFVAGIIAVVYRFVLAYEPILNFWFRFGDKYERKWFYKPVWGCAKCIAGQISFWFWLLFVITPAIIRHYSQISSLYHFTTHCAQTGALLILGLFCTISTAIVTAVILGPVIEKLKT